MMGAGGRRPWADLGQAGAAEEMAERGALVLSVGL
jgi:hypothetical protein